ncbi:MAG TPA: PHP-associated domain-containing protein [Acidimicrobiales bacterium]|nr:PHP-associated domain-containing protein [Acidimicrobiales bacterium]
MGEDGGRLAPSAEFSARHPHLADPRPVGTVRVDCHLHTMWSGDCTTTPAELAEALGQAALDVVCITDHSTITGALRLLEDGALPCRIVIGQEQRSPDGEVIGLFLSERIPAGLRSAREAVLAIRGQGGLVYVPHPFDPMRHRLKADVLRSLCDEGLVDVIEAINAKTSLHHLNEQAGAFTVRAGVAKGAGSDAHVPEAAGAAYVEMPDFADGDPASFMESLRLGRTVGHHFDAHRPWRARIVPSTGDRP